MRWSELQNPHRVLQGSRQRSFGSWNEAMTMTVGMISGDVIAEWSIWPSFPDARAIQKTGNKVCEVCPDDHIKEVPDLIKQSGLLVKGHMRVSGILELQPV